MILERPYDKASFDAFLEDFLPDYQKDERPMRTVEKSILNKVQQLGVSKETDITVIDAECEETDGNKRIAITQAAFKVLRDHGIRNALIAFHDGADQWRLSLLTSTLELTNGKVVKKDSNPRRYSYLLGIGAKTKTPYKYLLEKGSVVDIKSLKERFSVEIVNKQFYESIAELFTQLVGGERGKKKYAGLLKIHGSSNHNNEHQEFAVRLIGRIIFSWFLKEKKSIAGMPIIPDELLSLDALASHADYYHSILEPLFFELLNKRVNNRHETLRQGAFATVPYLNGGLFSPQPGDYYQQNSYTGGGSPGIVTIPDEWFGELFTVLEQYNFTVDENTSYDVDLSIDPEMLGRIFENLLAEINPETGESARKSTGSFYTPREIVDYMVDSALLEYLKSKTLVDEGKLRAVISWGQQDDKEYPLTTSEKKNIVDALASLTILDPACGSGAFPIGLLQKVVYILQQVDEKADIWLENQLKTVNSLELKRDIEEKYRNENYDWLRKLGVIRESIFGVDIQTIATEIAKLRCFLTLVIEEEVDDTKVNRGIRPLPNLDFKFVTANSLMGLPVSATKKPQPSGALNMFEDVTHIDRLKAIRNQYFGADADERARLQVVFKDLQLSMFKSRVESRGATSDLYNTLSDWNPFSHEKTSWFDSEWMFGIEGFDIVIANPPYVGEKGHKQIFDELKPTSLGKRYYKGKMDLFYFFFHLGIDNLSNQGILAFITTNYYPTADGALNLRKDFYNRTNVLELINFNEYKIFESALGQHNMITILQKSTPDEQVNTMLTFVNKKGGPNSNELNALLARTGDDAIYASKTRAELFDGSQLYLRFAMGSDEVQKILDKISRIGHQLKDYATTNEGVHTGLDAVADKEIRKYPNKGYIKGEGVFVLPRGSYSFPHLRPWFKGSSISHFVAESDSKYEVLYWDNDTSPSDDELKHLEKFRIILEDRVAIKRAGRPWYQLNWPRKQEMFEGQKIVNPYRSKKNYFALLDDSWYGSADVFFTHTKDPEVISNVTLTCILNSTLVLFWLTHKGKRKGDILEIKSVPIGQIPIALPTELQRDKLDSLFKEIVNATKTQNSAEIKRGMHLLNEVVYEMYNLTPEEISIIEDKSHE